jgi:hypothetical protein
MLLGDDDDDDDGLSEAGIKVEECVEDGVVVVVVVEAIPEEDQEVNGYSMGGDDLDRRGST